MPIKIIKAELEAGLEAIAQRTGSNKTKVLERAGRAAVGYALANGDDALQKFLNKHGARDAKAPGIVPTPRHVRPGLKSAPVGT
jgi:hypothetical protein